MVTRKTTPVSKESPDGDLSDKEKHLLKYGGKNFLKEFPKWKQEQVETIRLLHALADKVDATHEQTSKINMVVKFMVIFSRLMSLVGNALAPVTTRVSLMLLVAGQILEEATGITSDVTNLIEECCNKKVKALASAREPSSEAEVEQEEKACLTAFTKIMDKFQDTSETLRKSRRAYQAARVRPSLAMAAKHRLMGGKVSYQTSRRVRRAFGGTPLGMTKSALLEGGAVTTADLVWDLFNLSDVVKKMKGGEKAQLGKELRAQAQELEELVIKYSHHYEQLQQKLYFRSVLFCFVLLSVLYCISSQKFLNF